VKREITNLAASVNQRLLNLRDSRKEDFQLILNRFGLERFLYRISESPFADRLILKGAFSFELWGEEFYRPTRDADFLGFFEPSADEIRRVFMQICRQDVEPDGLVFDPDSVSAEAIRGQNILGGLRVQLMAYLGRIRIRLQFDICIGERLASKPGRVRFPAILSFPAPFISVYPKEMTIADKFHALCKLGMLNSRVKDHYDIFQLSGHFVFKGTDLKNGILTVFREEKSAIPSGIPDALSDAFGQLPDKRMLWRQFLIRIGKGSLDIALDHVIEGIRGFVLPPARAAGENKKFNFVWLAGGPWRPADKM
jgi:hypothetical protein